MKSIKWKGSGLVVTGSAAFSSLRAGGLCFTRGKGGDGAGGSGVVERSGDLARWAGDCVCVGWGHLDGGGGGWRGASAGNASGDGVAAAVFARWDEAGVCFDAHRGGEYLCADAGDRRGGAADFL